VFLLPILSKIQPLHKGLAVRTMNIKVWQQHCNVGRYNKQLYTLAGFVLGIFCSWGGRNDHNATPHAREENGFKGTMMIFWTTISQTTISQTTTSWKPIYRRTIYRTVDMYIETTGSTAVRRTTFHQTPVRQTPLHQTLENRQFVELQFVKRHFFELFQRRTFTTSNP
jgi:hypothetical protein